MNLKKQIELQGGFGNLDFLAKQVVEGFISGMHKSPFHGFSSEFAEHKVYNQGESTKHIDWKLFAKTDKFYTKQYDDETNLRCHFILDNSPSMHYPKLKSQSIDSFNKIGFSCLSIACLLELLKKQRDAFGLSIYNENYEYYAPEKGSERHRAMLLDQLNTSVSTYQNSSSTQTYKILHQIAEKLHKRSLVVLFSDMFQTTKNIEEIFEALQHLKYNKHEVIVFHTLDHNKEVNLQFGNKPTRFIDVETGDHIDIYAENAKDNYTKAMHSFTEKLKTECMKYKIKYYAVDINQKFDKLLFQFLIERQQFA